MPQTYRATRRSSSSGTRPPRPGGPLITIGRHAGSSVMPGMVLGTRRPRRMGLSVHGGTAAAAVHLGFGDAMRAAVGQGEASRRAWVACGKSSAPTMAARIPDLSVTDVTGIHALRTRNRQVDPDGGPRWGVPQPRPARCLEDLASSRSTAARYRSLQG